MVDRLTTSMGSFQTSNKSDTGSLTASQVPEYWSPFRVFLHLVVTHQVFVSMIFLIIIVNTVFIAIQTEREGERRLGYHLSLADAFFLGVYCFELFAKLYVYRWSFFESVWNRADAVIVALSFLEYLPTILASVVTINPSLLRVLLLFRTLKAIRALRVLRTISFLKNLQVIVRTLFRSIPALTSIILLLFLVLYTFAVVGRILYGELLPDNFGELWAAIFTLFQLITLDDWFTLYEAADGQDGTILAYLIIFIILETFIFINLFIAVIVNNLHEAQAKGKASSKRRLLKARSLLNAVRGRRRRQRTMRRQAMMNLAEDAQPEGLRDDADGEMNDGGGLGIDDTEGAGGGGADRVPAARSHLMDVEKHYGKDMPHRQKQLVAHYFMLLASLESSAERYQNQQKILDDLVDAVA